MLGPIYAEVIQGEDEEATERAYIMDHRDMLWKAPTEEIPNPGTPRTLVSCVLA